MKKIIALVIAILMMAAIAVPAFALDQNTTAGNVTVTYGVSDKYTVNIPSDVELGNKDAAVETSGVSASDVALTAGKKLTVTVASTNGWVVKSGEASVAYKMTYGSTDVSEGTAVVLEVASGTATGSKAITFTRTAEPTVAANNYSDTLTFTTAIVDITPAE